MKTTKILMPLIVTLYFLSIPGTALALFRDTTNGKWSLIGQFKTQATFRTEDSPDNTPIPLESGDMTSQRSLLMLQWKQDLGNRFFDTKIEYLVKGHAFYDGAWDYGAKAMSDDDYRHEFCLDNRDQIDDEKWGAEIFNAYVDMSKGPAFVRLGRQVTCWGEMSTIRILDGTNPMNASSMSVDLQERLIPLWMARGTLTYENFGPFDSVNLTGYYIPGKIDDTAGATVVDGSPILPTVGRLHDYELDDPLSMSSLSKYIDVCDSEIDSDRYGVKLGAVFSGIDFNMAYYRMYSDIPVPVLDASLLSPISKAFTDINLNRDVMGSLLGSQKLTMFQYRKPVDVYGISFNTQLDSINAVMRGEAAYQKDYPILSPGSIDDMVAAMSQKVTITGGLGGLSELMDTVVPPSMTKKVFPFVCGDPYTYNIVKYGIGFDKWVKIPLISSSDMMWIFEYVGSTILGYKSHQLLCPWQEPYDDDRDSNYDPVWVNKHSNTLIAIANTSYLNSNLNVAITTMYEIEPHALVIIPNIKYSYRQFDFTLGYFFAMSDNYGGTLGLLDKTDELSFGVSYTF